MADIDLTALSGIGPATAKILQEHGLSTTRDVAEVTLEALVAVPGFGPSRAKMVKAAAIRALGEGAPAPKPSVDGQEEPSTARKKGKPGKSKKSKKSKGKEKKEKKKASGKKDKRDKKGKDAKKKKGKGKKK